MRKIAWSCTVFFSFLFSHSVIADNMPCDGSIKQPCLVQDNNANTPEVKHLRDTQMIIANYSGNTTGLDNLWVSGSAATGDEGWKATASHINNLTHGKVKTMMNVDLRQESHGFLNGNSINLTSEYNWYNVGKDRQQILTEEKEWLHTLAMQKYIENILSPAQFKSGHFAQGINLAVDSVVDEATLTAKYGFEYFRLMITDHMAPRPDDVDAFVNLIDHLPENTWIHLHCRGGSGRTTTFMAMYDMLKNADKVSFDEIIRRQASVSPFYDLSQFDDKNPEMSKQYKLRFDFLRQFYQYTRARFYGYSNTWSAWSAVCKDKANDYPCVS